MEVAQDLNRIIVIVTQGWIAVVIRDVIQVVTAVRTVEAVDRTRMAIEKVPLATI